MSKRHNEITGDRLSSKIKQDNKFQDNWDKIFNPKSFKETKPEKPKKDKKVKK
jgi:hypothetical protein